MLRCCTTASRVVRLQWSVPLSPTTTALTLTDNGILISASSGDGSVYGVGSFQNMSPSPSPAPSKSVHVSIHPTRSNAPGVDNSVPGGTVAAIVITVLLVTAAGGAFVYVRFFKNRAAGYSGVGAPASGSFGAAPTTSFGQSGGFSNSATATSSGAYNTL